MGANHEDGPCLVFLKDLCHVGFSGLVVQPLDVRQAGDQQRMVAGIHDLLLGYVGKEGLLPQEVIPDLLGGMHLPPVDGRITKDDAQLFRLGSACVPGTHGGKESSVHRRVPRTHLGGVLPHPAQRSR